MPALSCLQGRCQRHPGKALKALGKLTPCKHVRRSWNLQKGNSAKLRIREAAGPPPSLPVPYLGGSQAGRSAGGLLLQHVKALKFSFPSPVTIKHILLSPKCSRTSTLAISSCISYNQPPTILGFCHYLLSGKSEDSPVKKCLIYFRSRRSPYPTSNTYVPQPAFRKFQIICTILNFYRVRGGENLFLTFCFWHCQSPFTS